MEKRGVVDGSTPPDGRDVDGGQKAAHDVKEATEAARAKGPSVDEKVAAERESSTTNRLADAAAEAASKKDAAGG